ncbi:MAG: hypothetical protein ACI97A_004057 [Planctomycetota bacterium]
MLTLHAVVATEIRIPTITDVRYHLDMEQSMKNAARVYESVLSHGQEGIDRYYAELRTIGITPTPQEQPGFLFAPNPVVLPRAIVETITRDLQDFCAARLRETPDAETLISTMPSALRPMFGQPEIATRILQDLHDTPPNACLDCFLTETSEGLKPAYLEWQTFPAYYVTAVHCLEAINRAYPGISEAGGFFSPIRGETLVELRNRVRRSLLKGIEDDPRQGVIVDFEPEHQETAFEFHLQVAMSGGLKNGLGVIDPREVIYQDGRPHYKREGQMIPIRSVFSRLVHGDIESRLLPALSAAETETLTRFFNETEHVAWRVHPLHFLYGTKGDFPRFHEQSLSKFIPACETISPETIQKFRDENITKLQGKVQKPIEGHGGRDVVENPAVDELEVGALLQDRIHPASHHQTLHGDMTPEIRIMAIPDDDGRLVCTSVFTRVKGPHEFRSNAGAIAARDIPGTGEGYALIVD